MRGLAMMGLLGGLLCWTGCASLDLNLKQASANKPSNVALYFSVETSAGHPVPNLTAETFQIYEDDQLISPYESKQTILNPEVAVIHYTLLLLDLSGSITESGALPDLVEAASSFCDKVSRKHQIAVFGFDGGAKLIPLVKFTKRAGNVRAGLKRALGKKVRDPSTNLNGAVVEAVSELEKVMAKAPQPLRFGTLVVFTDGTDRAHRVSKDAMLDRLDRSEINVFAIGLGGEISADQLAELGHTGFVKAAEGDMSGAFDRAAALIEAAARKFYLLSYCSPSRAGTHELRVELSHGEASGGLAHQFNADGFGPGCNPSANPKFKVGRIRIK
ncbi:MAG: VWA domain-containing protein [Deltaproteobacteria bacterium]|nr:VWA domain-containing protein [Deltaproteobacteria bacterium]